MNNENRAPYTNDINSSEIFINFLTGRGKVFLYGFTPDASYILDNFQRKVDGIIDRKKFDFDMFSGVKMVNLSAVTADSIVINCCSGFHVNEIELMLKEKSNFVINFFDFISLFLPNKAFQSTDCPFLKDWENFPKIFQQNVHFFDNFKTFLDDEISKQHYKDYLNGRLLGDISILGQQKSFQDQTTMYFQEFIPNIGNYKFLDIGGFDGSNSLAFMSISDSSHAICIEPNERNFENIRTQLNKYSDRIILLNNAIGKDNKKVNISNNLARSSVEEYTHQSNGVVFQKSLDTIFDELTLWGQKIYVKMDVEGAELDILRGAKRVLAEQNTIFAISCYHYSKDLVNFSNLLKPLLENRKIYFRHLTTGAYETVLFII